MKRQNEAALNFIIVVIRRVAIPHKAYINRVIAVFANPYSKTGSSPL